MAAAPSTTGARRRRGTAMQICSRLASRQEGVVRHDQLLRAGITPGEIKHLIRAGFLHRLHRGVYAVGHMALAPLAREQAALLACGDGAVLSHRSAAYLWGLLPDRPEEVDVTVPRCQRPKRGIRIHRGAVEKRDIRRRSGLRVTSPARALIDLAAEATPDEIGDAVAEARVKRLVRDGELEAAVERAGQAWGAARMRAYLRDEAGPAITRSRAERRFRKLLGDAQLPQPKVNARVGSLTVDFLWEAERIVLEVDGWKFHGHRRAFENDRRRDMILSDAGYHVIRVTWLQFTTQPLALIAHIARVLDRRSRVLDRRSRVPH